MLTATILSPSPLEIVVMLIIPLGVSLCRGAWDEARGANYRSGALTAIGQSALMATGVAFVWIFLIDVIFDSHGLLYVLRQAYAVLAFSLTFGIAPVLTGYVAARLFTAVPRK